MPPPAAGTASCRGPSVHCLRMILSGASVAELASLLSRVADRSATTGKKVVEHVHASLEAEGLNFSFEQVADFYLSLRTKPFVLLAGVSGTGKSILARRFADACGFPAALIPVRPDWSDPSELGRRGRPLHLTPRTTRNVPVPRMRGFPG